MNLLLALLDRIADWWENQWSDLDQWDHWRQL